MLVISITTDKVDGATEWYTLQNSNACNTKWKQGPCGKPEDAPGFHFVGSLPNATACQVTCEKASTNCTIWLWSANSKHCWWRLDNLWAPTNQKGVVSSCRQIASASEACVPGCGECPIAPTPAPTPFIPSREPNMNGEYLLSQTPHGNNTQHLFPTQYRDYPRGAEYFDVYSPEIQSLYSQVFWKGLSAVDLPDDIVKRYDGKGMAVIGFEMDQVRRTPSGDVSVPINVAYNHHFESSMVGKKSRLEKVTFYGPDDPRIAQIKKEMGHGIPSNKEAWVVRDLVPDNNIPTSQNFGGANGGEYRKSFHGYAPGFAQIIDSPQQIHITPMQIDTWNRDKMNLTGPTGFVPGPVPRNNLAPITGPDAIYSGLLECPLTTRVRKVIDVDYSIRGSGICTSVIATAGECFEAAALTFLAVSKKYLINSTGSDLSKPSGCSATTDAVDTNTIHVYFNKASPKSPSECGGNATLMAGMTSSLVKVAVELDVAKQIATINLTGPAPVWFGVGFNGSAMKDGSWAIIVDGLGKVTERKLADQSPGTELSRSVTVVSTTSAGGLRTVTMTRPFKGATKDHFTFDPAADTTLPFINAIGNKPDLSYHKDKRPSSLFLLPVKGTGACICPEKPAPFGQGKGKFIYVPVAGQSADVGSGTVNFGNRCDPQPRTDLLAMKNPICDVRTYVGGQTSCHHMWSLLDADQEIPWADQPLKYHLKFRFWVQPFNASYHNNAKRTTWGIASPVEYDIPKCGPGIMGCTQQKDGNWIHTIHGTFKGSGRLLAAHFHCHAPGCLSIAMYKCDKGASNCNATTGTLLCREEPVYGGTGKIDNKNMDEQGFILQPPCLWGSPEFGLEPPPNVNGLMLHSVKTSNATYGHHGEMAWQQMYYY